MALTATTGTQLTAVGTFISGVAEVNALKSTLFLNSGWVAPPDVSGAFAIEATSVKFPKFDASAVVAADLPADGSPVPNSYTVSETFDTVNMTDKIVPYRYMPLAANRSIDGEALHLQRIGKHIGGLIGNTVQADIVAKLVASANGTSRDITSGIGATITPAGLLEAVALLYGESSLHDFAVLLSLKQYSKLIAHSDVIQAHKSSIADLSGRPIANLFGMPLIPCSDLTLIEDGGGAGIDTYKAVVVRRGVAQAYLSNVRSNDPTPVQASGSMHIDSFFSFATYVSPAGVIPQVMTYETL